MQTVLKDLDTRMNSALEVLAREFAGVRTGRASAGLLESVRVDYYGNPTPISQMASVSVPDARTLVIQPWEAAQLKEVEKAIMKSDLGIQPVNDGKVIRLTMPTPTRSAASSSSRTSTRWPRTRGWRCPTGAARPTTNTKRTTPPPTDWQSNPPH